MEKLISERRQAVYVKTVPVYKSKGESKLPKSFNVTYSIDGGKPIVKDINNAPGDNGK